MARGTATATAPLRQRLVTYAWLGLVVILAVAVLTVWRAASAAGFYWPVWGQDLDLYLEATRRWLAGGSFYPAAQLAGPYPVEGLPTGQQPILYPPTALVLFVPFTVLPAALWWLVPLGVTTWRIVALRPSWLAWACIGLLAAWPQTIYNVITGNPGLWVMAFVALATRWPAFGPWVLLKPTLFPFALMGLRPFRRPIGVRDEAMPATMALHRVPASGRNIRLSLPNLLVEARSRFQDRPHFLGGHGPRVTREPNAIVGHGRTLTGALLGSVRFERTGTPSITAPRRPTAAAAALDLTLPTTKPAGRTLSRQWLAGLAAFALVSAVFLPMWPDYLTVLRNAQAGLLYSVPQASLPLIPLVAWLGRRAVDDVPL